MKNLGNYYPIFPIPPRRATPQVIAAAKQILQAWAYYFGFKVFASDEYDEADTENSHGPRQSEFTYLEAGDSGGCPSGMSFPSILTPDCWAINIPLEGDARFEREYPLGCLFIHVEAADDEISLVINGDRFTVGPTTMEQAA